MSPGGDAAAATGGDGQPLGEGTSAAADEHEHAGARLRGGPPVVVAYVHDEAMACAGMALHVAHGERAWRRWVLRGAGLYLLFAGVMCLTLWEQSAWMPVLAALFAAGGVFAFRGRKPLALWMTRRRHRERPDSDRPLVIELRDEQIDMHVEGLADATFRWQHVTKAVLAGSALLLYITADEYIHVPREHLDADGLARVLAQVHDSVGDVRVIDPELEASG